MLFEKLARLGLIEYEVAAFYPTEYNTLEFYVSLRLLDRSEGRASLLSRQIASFSRFKDVPVATREVGHAGDETALMEVSRLEGRAVVYKRKTLERIRQVIQRGRRL